MPIKYQENTKKFGSEIPNTNLVLVFSWYTKFLVTDWHQYSRPLGSRWRSVSGCPWPCTWGSPPVPLRPPALCPPGSSPLWARLRGKPVHSVSVTQQVCLVRLTGLCGEAIKMEAELMTRVILQIHNFNNYSLDVDTGIEESPIDKWCFCNRPASRKPDAVFLTSHLEPGQYLLRSRVAWQ